MALSYVTYPGNGVTTNFSVTFGYITAADVKVYVDGVLKSSPADYTWFNSTTIQFGTAPANGTVVRFERSTKNDARWVDFQDAGNLTEADLDLNSNQMFYLAQESIDLFNDLSLKLTGVLTWDAQSHRIVNVADPVDAQDAATKNWFETQYLPSVQASAAAAAASAAAALSSENDAAASAAAALVSEGAAYGSEVAADANALEAEHWATYPEDSQVPEGVPGDYSAYHWSKKAEGWASSLSFPSMSGQGTKFLRANAAETGWEYYNLLNELQVIQVTTGGSSLWTFKSNSVALDSAVNGIQIKASDDSLTASFVGVPGAQAAVIYVGGYGAGDIKFTAGATASKLELASGDIIQYNGKDIALLNATAAQAFSGVMYFTNSVVLASAVPVLYFQETDTVDQNWSLSVASGRFYMHQQSDAFILGNAPFQVAQAAPDGALQIESTGVVMPSGWTLLPHASASLGFDSINSPDGYPFKRITCNDGAGNFNFRAGEYFDSTLKWATTGGGSAAVVLSFEAATGQVDLHTSDNASAVAGNAVGTFGAQYLQYGTGYHQWFVSGTKVFELDPNYTYSYRTMRISNAQPQLHFHDTGTTNKDWMWQVSAGVMYLTNVTDAGAGVWHAITIDDAVINQTSLGLSVYGNKILSWDDLRMGEWGGGAGYTGLFHASGAANNYMIMSESNNTYISCGAAAGSIYLRPGNNSSTGQLLVTEDYVTHRGYHIGRFAKYKTADETVNNSAVIQNDNHLFFSGIPAGFYKIEVFLRVATTVTADFKGSIGDVNFTGTEWVVWEVYESSTGYVESWQGSTLAGSVSVSATATCVIKAEAYAYCTGNGSLTLGWAQATAEASNLTVYAGSFMIVERIA